MITFDQRRITTIHNPEALLNTVTLGWRLIRRIWWVEMTIKTKRIYDKPESDEGYRVVVMRYKPGFLIRAWEDNNDWHRHYQATVDRVKRESYPMKFFSREKCDNCGSRHHLTRIYIEEESEKLFLCEPCHADLRNPQDMDELRSRRPDWLVLIIWYGGHTH
jgi:hypothetical protein